MRAWAHQRMPSWRDNNTWAPDRMVDSSDVSVGKWWMRASQLLSFLKMDCSLNIWELKCYPGEKQRKGDVFQNWLSLNLRWREIPETIKKTWNRLDQFSISEQTEISRWKLGLAIEKWRQLLLGSNLWTKNIVLENQRYLNFLKNCTYYKIQPNIIETPKTLHKLSGPGIWAPPTSMLPTLHLTQFSLVLKQVKNAPTSRTLHSFFPLPGMFFPKMFS